MNLIRKYKQLQDVPRHIASAYKNKRYSIVIPNTEEFKKERMYWSQVDFINYIAMKGRVWYKDGKPIKL